MTRFGFEVEFLTGVSVASTPYKRDESEWPPHPDRLFQALVAAWGRNDPPDDGEQAALEWLEVLNHEYLAVSAPPAHPRSVAAAYVPPNDLQTTTRLRDSHPITADEPGSEVLSSYGSNREACSCALLVGLGRRAERGLSGAPSRPRAPDTGSDVSRPLA